MTGESRICAREEETPRTEAAFGLGNALERLLLDLIRRPAMAVGPAGEILGFNGAASDFLGIVSGARRCPCVGDLGSPSLEQAVSDALGGSGRAIEVVTPLCGLGGARRSARCDGVSYARPDGRRGALLLLTDLRPLSDEGPERSHELSLIALAVASSAHEIKNAITGFEGGATLVRMGLQREDLDRVRKGWSMAERNLGRIQSLVADVLAFSRDAPLLFTEGRLDQVAAEAVAEVKPRAYAAGVCLTLEAEDAAPTMPLCKKALHQCTVNLIANAVAAIGPATGRSRREVNVRVFRRGAGLMALSVSDSGAGIPAEQIPKILAGFRTTKGSGGTGLGLLVVQKHLKAHGGRLEVESREGHGAAFTMVLPLPPEAGSGEPPRGRDCGASSAPEGDP